MNKANFSTGNRSTLGVMQPAGRPTIPSGRQPLIERKTSDPSSSLPKGERYPLPMFTDSRLKSVEE
jgi:hypothetical protein